MKRQSSSTLKIAVLLTFIGGFLEIYSFLLKGEVFATTITGNIILMMYNIYDLNFIAIPKYVMPIISFIFGIFFVESVRRRYKDSIMIHWREYIIMLEILLVLLIVIFKSPYFNIFTTSMISFFSAVQIQTFKKTEGAAYMSTMCTGNTKKLVESYISGNRKDMKVYATILSAFSMGVVTGALLIEYIGVYSILFLLIPLMTLHYLIHRNI